MNRSIPIDNSPDLIVACDRLLDDLGDWIDQCIGELADAPPTDGHDQGTFTIPWAAYVQARSAWHIVDFMAALRDKVHDHFAAADRWHHGYWRMADVHHGTEHFELFLGSLYRLAPDDETTVDHLLDASEHTGNWVRDLPPWFDWDTGLFRGLRLGTDGVEAPVPVNLAPHLRCANIALLAHEMTEEPPYLDLAARHVGRWADAILASDQLPSGIDATGPVYTFRREVQDAYRSFAGQAPELTSAVDRAENLLASDAVNTHLDLWELTGESRFLDAAAAIVDVLATQLDDPDAGCAADAIRDFRRTAGDDRYDHDVVDAVLKLGPYGFAELAIEPEPQRDRRPPGIGKRQDMPLWFEDGQPRRHSPILLAVAAEIAGDPALATRAVDLARAYFALARACYPHGRDHGCSARTVSAIARGHGRENNAGVITAVLEPLLTAFGLFESP